jgi:hypothetical protein
MSHCTTFQRCACLTISHFKILNDFHNMFAYYVEILTKQDIRKKIISFHFIKWEIGVYFVETNVVCIHIQKHEYTPKII